MRLLRILLASIALVSCADEIGDSVVPAYNVRYSCNTTLVNAVLRQTEQPGLDCQGGYVRVYDKSTLGAGDVVGVGGLLILQNFESSFFAYDLACPYCYSKGKAGAKVCRIDIDHEDGFTAVCQTCESKFGSVFWGSPAPTAGPANAEKLILRQYRVQRLPDGVTVTVMR